ncbi:HPP family protein [Chitinimonas koreensis]|uniref:HPP family protein n=1 Tax=Chitinimonas koreensis TaxID=356302 RepID=UPI0003FE73A3|nr:HPP family protein [Chitinimonas koreensis]QNM95917.1 HPP family protein [Chitinimonas koreensis]
MKLPTFLPASAAPAAPPLRDVALNMLGALAAIAATGLLGRLSGQPWLMAPFGASCVLVFALPDSPLAQPRSVIGGHFLSALVGFAVLGLFGGGWPAMAAAVALAIGAMQLTRTVHAPAGATPLLVLASQPGPAFLFAPVLLGSLAIVAVAWLANNLRRRGSYPRYWY